MADRTRERPSGEPYAAADGERLRAERTFWPVLTSADGHDRLLGYKADRTGPIAAAVEEGERIRTDAGRPRRE